MDLAPLTRFLSEHPAFAEAPKQSASFAGLSTPAQRFFAAALHQTGNPWLLVARNSEQAKQWQSDLAVYGVDAALFPAVEIAPYAGISPEEELRQERQGALVRILEGAFPIVTTAKALSLLVPSKESFSGAILRLQPGASYPPQILIQQLVKLGFRPAAAVTEKGEFARRGGVLDFYPPQLEAPVRVDWFDDEIESLRSFDPQSQRSLETLETVTVWPSRELILPEQGWERIAEGMKASMNPQSKRLRKAAKHDAATALESLVKVALDRLGSFQPFEGCEYYLPFFSKLECLFDYLPKGTTILWEDKSVLLEHLSAWHEEQLKTYRKRTEAGEALELPSLLHHSPEELLKRSQAFPQIDFSSGGKAWDAPHAPAFGSQWDRLAESASNWSKAGEKVVIVSSQPHRAYAILDERQCHSSYGSTLPEPSWPVGGVWIVRDTLHGGFRWPDLKLTVLSDAELFGWTKTTRKKEKKKPSFAGSSFSSVLELREGDFVVHLKHGIGLYHGLRKLTLDGEEREYLLVTYQGEDRLYVPVDQIGMLHRYRGGAELKPKLHKMGGAEWEAVKKRVKKSVQIVAEDLLKLYAERASQPGYAFPPDTVWQGEMEEAFPYQETVDQLRAIAETKQDMERPRPMDRLVCGDVGFGKTEVALRAAFKAIMAGKQVAVLAPTTLLAQQHFQVFRDRFAPYPISCSLLSRFRTPKEVKETMKGLLTGSIEFVVGTHRLLQKDVQFKDLGLLIIDEEHRFGVAHKERLKQLKHSVDVLTMSATPIPRTLYLALSGARDMSLITTPPLNRHPIKTEVGPYDGEVIKTAILHELERDGQVFLLHNRVDSIYAMAEEVGKLVPQARVAVAHGQMPEGALEDVMFAFLNREYDVLVTTTIIESGLDIPNANTIVVDHADKLGLAQLYQIRGRVGRSDRKAYCYCLYPRGKQLTEDARDRLAAISQYTALGSGYQIALRDLEIRGVGNILGEEQHGHMLAVGYDVYMQLLEETIGELSGGEEAAPMALVDLSIAAFIPDEWGGKMEHYKRLAGVMSVHELDFIEEEWQDRNGKLPPSVKNLLRVVRIKLRATALGVRTIRSDAHSIRVEGGVDRKSWANCQLKQPGLARWQWGKDELQAPRSGGSEQQLEAIERLLTALEAQTPALTAG